MEQATFVLYLHSCRIGWDKITEPILVCREVDEEVGQDATETSVTLTPGTHRVDFSLKLLRTLPTIKSWSEKSTWPHRGHQSQLDERQRQEAVQSFTLIASDLVASFL